MSSRSSARKSASRSLTTPTRFRRRNVGTPQPRHPHERHRNNLRRVNRFRARSVNERHTVRCTREPSHDGHRVMPAPADSSPSPSFDAASANAHSFALSLTACLCLAARPDCGKFVSKRYRGVQGLPAKCRSVQAIKSEVKVNALGSPGCGIVLNGVGLCVRDTLRIGFVFVFSAHQRRRASPRHLQSPRNKQWQRISAFALWGSIDPLLHSNSPATALEWLRGGAGSSSQGSTPDSLDH